MQTWLITGCSSGLGRGFAKAVLKSGDQVSVTARRVETLKDLVDAYPEQALALSLDVTKEEDIKNAVEKGLERFGTIDVLINNAGYGYRAAVEEGVPKEVDQLFQTNLFGPIALIKAVLPIMRKNHCERFVHRRFGRSLGIRLLCRHKKRLGIHLGSPLRGNEGPGNPCHDH